MVKTYVRPPPMFVKGEGSYLWDVENRKYLDFTAGIAVNALGHCDPEMTKLIAQQVRVHLAPNSPSQHRKYQILTFQTGKNTNPHLEPLPQSLDRRTLRTPRPENPRIRRHA